MINVGRVDIDAGIYLSVNSGTSPLAGELWQAAYEKSLEFSHYSGVDDLKQYLGDGDQRAQVDQARTGLNTLGTECGPMHR